MLRLYTFHSKLVQALLLQLRIKILAACLFMCCCVQLGRAQAVLVKDINPGFANSIILNQDFTNVNGIAYFRAKDGTNGAELWKSDGTTTGTVMVKNINSSGDSDPAFMVDLNGTLLFRATNGNQGRELWQSDGTSAGTNLVKDIWLGAPSSLPSFLTATNGSVYFGANNGTLGSEFWKSDGSTVGTVLVKDINPGSDPGITGLITFLDINGTLFFRALNASSGFELWKSDGTTAGTTLVKDINPGSGNGNPWIFAEMNGILFFVANDGVNGPELWKSDGTAAGTVMVKDIVPGSAGASPYHMIDINGTLFFVANDGINGSELWKSDGTTAGTVMVKNIYPGSGNSSPSNFVELNGILYFAAFDPNGHELWKSDGTAAGTVMVKDIRSGGSSFPTDMTEVNGTLFFSANDGINGIELWQSDGTTAGTKLVADILPGSGSSSPQNLSDINGTLFFRADDGTHGIELWKATAIPSLPDSLEFVVETDSGGEGDTVLLSITVNHFDSIATHQGTINFDPSILSFQAISNPSPLISNIFGLPGSGSVPTDAITFSWIDPGLSTTSLTNGTAVMEISFVIKPGAPIGLTPVQINGSPTALGYATNPNATVLSIPSVSQGGIDILDTQPPIISCPPSFNQDTDPGMCGAMVTFSTPIGSDNLPGHSVLQIAGPQSGSLFPLGTTTVSFQATDAAGNTASCSFDVTVIDQLPPTVLTQDITVSLDANGMATITAAQVDNGTTDPCGLASLSLDISTVDCSDIGQPVSVNLTATDVHGNSASASALLTVQADPVISLTGAAFSRGGDSIPGVIFDMSGDDGPLMQTAKSFAFLAAPCFSTNDIGADKIDDAASLNGLDIGDATALIDHILNITPFTNPYQRIAADLNASSFFAPTDPSKINNLDVIQLLQKITLSQTHFFNPQTGVQDAIWTFIPSDYVFPNPTDPVGFASRRAYLNPNPSTDQNFIGVKLGDVTNDWNHLVLRRPAPEDSIFFEHEPIITYPGETITISLRPRDFQEIRGYQFTLQWDPEVLQFLSVNHQALHAVYGTNKTEEGILTAAWADLSGQGITLLDTSIAFDLRFKVVGEWGSETDLEINSAMIPNMARDDEGTYLGIGSPSHPINIGTVTDMDSWAFKGYSLSQNSPNPFQQSTSLTFSLGQAEEVDIRIYTLTGQIIRRFEGTYPAGDHEILWNGTSQTGKPLSEGIYLLNMKAGDFNRSKRMVKIR
ncbi:MAG: ELWxxDGT repeat protein [Bacteroidota bacterium]